MVLPLLGRGISTGGLVVAVDAALRKLQPKRSKFSSWETICPKSSGDSILSLAEANDQLPNVFMEIRRDFMLLLNVVSENLLPGTLDSGKVQIWQ